MRITRYRVETDQQRYMLVKESTVNYEADSLMTDEKLCRMFNDLYRLNRLAEEHVFLVAFSNKGKPMGIFEISHGTGNMSLVQPREVFIRLALIGASSFALVHNHPSGDCTPSKEDMEVTRRMQGAGQLMGIGMLDHIIAGNPDHYSFHAHGLLPA